MTFTQRILTAISIVLLSLFSLTAHANIVEYKFTTPGGVERILPPTSLIANPKGPVTFSISSGLNRKIKLSIKNTSGSTVSTKTSDLIGSEDKFILGGLTYYGFKMDLNAPADGNYTIEVVILDSANAVVSTQNFSWIVDTQGPVISDLKATDTGYGHTITGTTWKLGLGAQNNAGKIYSDGFSDANGITNAILKTYLNNVLVGENPMNVDSVNKIMSRSFETDIFPHSDLDQLFEIQLEVTDEAGNVTKSNKQQAYFDSISNHPTAPYGVYDPDSTGTLAPGLNKFVAYTPGMEVKTNPIRLVWKLKKNDYAENRDGGVRLVNAIGENTVAATDTDHVYIISSSPFGYTNSNFIRWSNFGQWGGGSIEYNLVLAASAPKSPVMLNAELYYSDIGWGTIQRPVIQNTILPLSATRGRITVEARPYTQYGNFNDTGISVQCTIPAGQTLCEFDVNITMQKNDAGYWHGQWNVTNPDGTLRSGDTWNELDWNDLYYPEITSTSYDPVTKKLIAQIRQPGRGQWFDRLRLGRVEIRDQNNNALSVTQKITSENGEFYEFEFDLRTLPQGTYDLSLAAIENHGPTTKKSLFTFTSDRTYPTLNFSFANGATITSLNDISISVADNMDPTPTITSVTLTGGQASEDLSLSRRIESTNTYKIEPPVLFPTAGLPYTLTVKVRDTFGNETVESRTFEYAPPVVNLNSDGEPKWMPAYTGNLSDGSQNPVVTSPAIYAGANLLTGTHDVIVTLRKDSGSAAYVHGTLVQPGQSATLRAYNFTSTSSRFKASVYPADASKEVTMNLLIQPTATSAPTLMVSIQTFLTNMTLKLDKDTITQVIEPANATITLANEIQCALQVGNTTKIGYDFTNKGKCYLESKNTDFKTDNFVKTGLTLTSDLYLNSVATSYAGFDIVIYSGTTLERIVLASSQSPLSAISARGAIGQALVESQTPLYHKVNQSTLTLQNATGFNCNQYTTSESEATSKAQSGINNIVCHVNWTTKPLGLLPQPDGKALTGELQTAGAVPVGYELSVFNKAGNKVTVETVNKMINVVTPPAPSISKVDLEFAVAGVKPSTSEVLYHSPNDDIKQMKVYAPKQLYVQKADFNGMTCLIPAGADFCLLPANYKPNIVNAQGEESLTLSINTHSDYFESSVPFNVTVNKDSRPATGVAVYQNRKVGPSVVINGTPVALDKDELIVHLQTPHLGRPGTWWHQSNGKLRFTHSAAFKPSNVLVDGDESIRFNNGNIGGSASKSLTAKAFEVVGSDIIARFDASEILDGQYDLSFSSEDQYGIATAHTFTDETFDKNGPVIQVKKLNLAITGSTPINFLSELKVYAYGGWDDGSKLTQILVNGVDIGMTETTPQIAIPKNGDWPANSALTMTVKAIDRAGNTSQSDFPINYQPVDFTQSSSHEAVHQRVEALTISISQNKGIKCKLALTTKEAIENTGILFNGCTIDVQDLPAGLNTAIKANKFILEGSINDKLGAVTIPYNIRFFTLNGESDVVYTGKVDLYVLPSTTPTIQLSELNKLGEGVYGIPYYSKTITKATFNTVPADVTFSVKDASGNAYQSKQYKQRPGGDSYKIATNMNVKTTEKRTVWNSSNLTVQVAHDRDPSSKVDYTIQAITLPDSGMKHLLTTKLVETSTDQNIVATSALGATKQGSFSYDANSMGLWETYLAYKADDGSIVPIGTATAIDSLGKVELRAQASGLFGKSKSFFAVAKSKGPFDQYQRTIISNSLRLSVLKGEAIEGGIVEDQVVEAVPFSALLNYEAKSINDRNASDKIEWEYSTDKTSWSSVVSEKDSQRMLSIAVNTPGTTYYRVKMTNRLSKVVSYSNISEVIGYALPPIKLNAPDYAYTGQDVIATAESKIVSSLEDEGKIEWSTDQGKTWIEGDSAESFTIKADTQIMMRYLPHTTTSEVGNKGYVYASKLVRAVEPQPLKVKVFGPKHAEVGTKVTLSGTAQHATSQLNSTIVTQWTTPAGTVLTGPKHDYVISEADIVDGDLGSFIFKAHTPGIDQTSVEKPLEIALWKYTMPKVSLDLLSTLKVAPAIIAARISTPYFFAPGVEISYSWILPEGVVVDRTTSSLTYLRALKSGVHKIGVKAKDNRGNTQEEFKFIEIVEATDMESTIDVKPSNEFLRAPMMYAIKTNAKPGHPNDKIIAYDWFVDDVQEMTQARPYANIAFKKPGVYSVKVRFTSDFGQISEETISLTVNQNQPPMCKPTITDTGSSITVNSNCTDEDGKIVGIKYQWREDGAETSAGKSLRFTKSLHDSLHIIIRATDDSGDQTTAEISWNK